MTLFFFELLLFHGNLRDYISNDVKLYLDLILNLESKSMEENLGR